MSVLDPAWLRVYRDVGGDRYLSHAELPAEAAPAARTIWEIYDRLFGRLTHAGLDPRHHRFGHGQRTVATPVFPRGVPIVIAGTGPSLDAGCDELRRVRERVFVATSLRGAAALQARGLHADLVLIEHPTTFDAQAAADVARDEGTPRLSPATAVLAAVATPPSLLDAIGGHTCRLATTLPSWGLWPATLAALALDDDAPAVGLIGLDAGIESPVDAAQRPLLALLGLLAYASGVCRDCGRGPVQLAGAPRASILALAEMGTEPCRPIAWAQERPAARLLDEGRRDLSTVEPLLADARPALDLALQTRAGNLAGSRELTRAIELMLAWGSDPHLRHVLQHGLGLSFLPAIWRTGVRIGSERQLWRPLVLALHELVTQADKLAAAIDARRPPAAQLLAPGRRSRPAPVAVHPAAVVANARGERVPDASSDAPPACVARVTVLLPLRNGLPHVHDALTSLLAQTHPDVEILVIDDGSDDGGPQEVQARGLSQVRVIPSNGHGLAAALNTGLRLATGAFIARQDADAWSHPERLMRQCEYLSRHPDVGLLATCADFTDAEGRPIETAWTVLVRREHDPAQTPPALARLLPRTCGLLHGTVMARSEVLRLAGGYRVGFASAQDYDLSLRLLPHTRFAKLPTRLSVQRLPDRPVTQQQQDQQRRAQIRARLEFLVRQVPRLDAGAPVALAGDLPGAEAWLEIGRDVGLNVTDDMLPSAPGPAGGYDGSWRDVLASADGLLVTDAGQLDAWQSMLAASGEARWRDVGPCLIRTSADE